MEQTNVQIGLRIKELREEKNMTRLEFSDSIGIDNSTLGKIEKGTAGLPKPAILEITSKYGVSYDWLIFGRGPKYGVPVESNSNETGGELLLKIYENTLNSMAYEQANAEMVKEIYQKVMGADDMTANARHSALVSRFLIAAARGQMRSGKGE